VVLSVTLVARLFILSPALVTLIIYQEMIYLVVKSSSLVVVAAVDVGKVVAAVPVDSIGMMI